MTANPNDPLAELRHEFAAGLADRLGVMQRALAVLRDRYDPAEVEAFYYKAHSLKGTAASFGADDLAEEAAMLADLGRVWMDRGGVRAEEVADAAAALERLETAVRAYRELVEGSA
jgi:chemotaxis protein histidine kinase CheA